MIVGFGDNPESAELSKLDLIPKACLYKIDLFPSRAGAGQMKEPRNSGLCYAYAYLTLDRHHQLQSVGSSGALGDRGAGKKRLVLVSLRLITGPRLYQIAHIARFLWIS